MNLTPFDKAIAGGLVSLIVSELARFGFQPKGTSVTALEVIVTGLVSYVAGHLVVYFAKNKIVSATTSTPDQAA